MVEGIRWSRRCHTAAAKGGGRARARHGLTLVEIALALTILVFAVLAFLQALVSSSESTASTRELATAEQAARQQMERLKAADFEDTFALYDSSAANDPGGAGTAPGRYFEVPGLEPLPDDADGFVGEVLFPEGSAGVLREDLALAELGLPRDLNGDGVIDSADHSGDYQVLPVRVRLFWRGSKGPASLELKTILGDF